MIPGDARPAAASHVAGIDGLRAIAIGAVILFHLRPTWLPGGLGGVDLFFVISGFVVTASMLRQPVQPIRALTIGFFARRIRRIVPALVAMLLVTSLASVLLIPLVTRYTLAGGTAIAAAGGAANIYLAVQQGAYLMQGTNLNPLIHSWTLGVEEQFYLIFPFLFYLLRRGPARAVGGVAAACCVSILIATVPPGRFPLLKFYMMPTRFWELGSGVLLCLWFDRWKSPGVAIPNWAATAFASLCLLVLAFCFRYPVGAFPMPGAFPIVAASLGLIAVCCLRPSEPVARLLSIAPVRYVGRLSYSIYLLHWPVIALFYWTIGLRGWANVLGALTLSVALALVSYYLVERPFRRAGQSGQTRPARVVAIGICALLACAGACALIFLARPLLTLSKFNNADRFPLSSAPLGCPRTVDQSNFGGGELYTWLPHCTKPAGPGRLVIVGDSHARGWTWVMQQYAGDAGVTVQVLAQGGCEYPSLSRPMAERPQCRVFYAAATDYLLRTLKPGDVVLMVSLHYPNKTPGPEGIAASLKPLPAGTEAEYVALTRRLAATGARLVMEAPTPVVASPAFRCMDRFNRDNPACGRLSVDRATIDRMRDPLLARMRRLTKSVPDMEIWDPLPALCPGERCSAIRDGKPIFVDTDHLNFRGHALMYPGLRKTLAQGPGR